MLFKNLKRFPVICHMTYFWKHIFFHKNKKNVVLVYSKNMYDMICMYICALTCRKELVCGFRCCYWAWRGTKQCVVVLIQYCDRCSMQYHTYIIYKSYLYHTTKHTYITHLWIIHISRIYPAYIIQPIIHIPPLHRGRPVYSRE